MDGYNESSYGESIAGVYDELYNWIPSSQQIDLLAELAKNGRAKSGRAKSGRALELGIGTGRVALPLAATGVDVHGLDSSVAMVEQMRAKPGGEAIEVTFGDFATFSLRRRFDLIFVAFNTFFALLTQDEQISCLSSVSEHLAPGGTFVMEAFVPDPARFSLNQRTQVSHMDLARSVLDLSMHSPAAQRVDSQHVVLEDGKPVRLIPISLRYAWPAELDLMARLVGMRLRDRWSNWDRSPFGDESTKHISLWEAAA